ncbi:toprim domain-containing protein [Botrimarina hoheduenensis]|uniref:DUF3991 domain-containing protein n=1 Tax=Botrimarina hoheduenensis TaxID=2528000 RepID=A0A5C5VYG2_9BACT|nr:toprim domain-containing protein [Botrimarina hoheduenensis]TWT43464.1 hypothetical protein Pla111_24150 [Botrimarina hoheduenensis]
MDRDSELDAFKSVNLSLIASAFGYEIVRKKSTRHSVLMTSGSDKIIVAQNDKHYVYFSVHDPLSSGTVIDFVQKAIEPGCSLGRVRQILRPFLGGGHMASVQQKHEGRYQAEISPSEPDLIGVASRFARFEPIEKPHPYLCKTRGIPFDLLNSPRLEGRVLHCPHRHSIVFPHWGSVEAADQLSAAITGYEIKGRGVNLFSKGGKKGLWMSAPTPDDRILAIAESGLDALSYLMVRGEEGIRIGSISGQMNAQQPELIRRAIESMAGGSQIVAAFDNDARGDEMAAALEQIVRSTCLAVEFRDDRPDRRGSDWNDLAMTQAKASGRLGSITRSFGR